MHKFLYNTAHLNNHADTLPVLREEWQRHYEQELKIPEEVSKNEFWRSLTAEEYTRIYKQAQDRMRTRPYDWQELTLSDALLLLGNTKRLIAALPKYPQIKLNQKLLFRAVSLSTLEVIHFLVENKGIKFPMTGSTREASTHNTYEVLEYVAKNTNVGKLGTEQLYSAIIGRNYAVAIRLINDGAEITEEARQMFYIQFIGHDKPEMLRFWIEHDEKVNQHLAFATKAAFSRGAIDCLKYLIEEKQQQPAIEWLKSKPPKNDIKVAQTYAYIEEYFAASHTNENNGNKTLQP